MENLHYLFQVTSYDTHRYLPQVSKALEKRVELVSRGRYASLWKVTDKLNCLKNKKEKRKFQSTILSYIYLIIGIFLFIPGVIKPQELMIPLLAGMVALMIGISGLLSNKKSPFDKSAQLLLESKDVQSSKIVFDEMGMDIEKEYISYHKFECIIETEDLFLLVDDTRVTLLQKKDLTTSTVNDFRNFISEKILNYHIV